MCLDMRLTVSLNLIANSEDQKKYEWRQKKYEIQEIRIQFKWIVQSHFLLIKDFDEQNFLAWWDLKRWNKNPKFDQSFFEFNWLVLIKEKKKIYEAKKEIEQISSLHEFSTEHSKSKLKLFNEKCENEEN